MTVMEIINEAQKLVRLPQSAAVTDPHAKMCLSWINDVQRNYMTEDAEWDALKVYTTLNTVVGTATYAISIASTEIDVLKNLQTGTSDPLEPLDDEVFRSYKRSHTSAGEPKVYRIRSRDAAGSVTVELCPTPDAVYTYDIEAFKKPVKVTAAADVPELDADTVLLGLIMLIQKDKGLDYTGEAAAFKMKMGGRSLSEGDSNFGDVEGV